MVNIDAIKGYMNDSPWQQSCEWQQTPCLLLWAGPRASYPGIWRWTPSPPAESPWCPSSSLAALARQKEKKLEIIQTFSYFKMKLQDTNMKIRKTRRVYSKMWLHLCDSTYPSTYAKKKLIIFSNSEIVSCINLNWKISSNGNSNIVTYFTFLKIFI